MVRDGLVIGIPGFSDPLCGSHLRDFADIAAVHREAEKAVEIFGDLLCNCARENAGICSGIGGELLLVELLRRVQRLIRADFKKP